MLFKKALIVAHLCIAGVAMAQTPTTNSYPTTKYREFVPIAPIEYFDNVEIANAEGAQSKYIKSLTKGEMLKLLTNETVLTAVAEVDKDGNISYIPSRISKKNKQYIITMDYVKFTTIDIKNGGDRTGEGCVGVGLRMVANISAKADNINLGDLFAISLAAKEKQVYGSLRLEVIGLHDPQITASMPLPSEISAASIQSMIQTMSTIKYKIYENGIELSPQILAIRTAKDGVTLTEITETVMNYHDWGKKSSTNTNNNSTQLSMPDKE